jgi:hypothetical protein
MCESRDTFMPGPLAELLVRILIHCQGSQDSNASPIDYEQIPSEAKNPQTALSTAFVTYVEICPICQRSPTKTLDIPQLALYIHKDKISDSIFGILLIGNHVLI